MCKVLIEIAQKIMKDTVHEKEGGFRTGSGCKRSDLQSADDNREHVSNEEVCVLHS